MRSPTCPWLRMLIAAALLCPTVTTAEALADDGVSQSAATKPPPGKKKPPPKKGKKGKKGKNKGPKMVGPFKKGEYPLQEKFRPLVLPNGMGEVTVAPGYQRTEALGVGADAVDTVVDFDYGIGDLVELGLGTGLQWAPDVAWSDEIHVHVHWLAADLKTFDLAAGVVVPFTFEEGAPLVVGLDALGRYLLDERFFLTFGRSVFEVTVNPDFALAMNVNAGLGVQIDKPFFLWLDTTLLRLPLAPDPDVTGPWEQLAVAIGGQYTAARTFDVGLVLSYQDNFQVAEEFTFGAKAFGRIRF